MQQQTLTYSGRPDFDASSPAPHASNQVRGWASSHLEWGAMGQQQAVACIQLHQGIVGLGQHAALAIAPIHH